ncbi:tannase/feruloyl esterase family alpha/beta hydrolase [Alloacidobacterium dinghuense]|uniref:Tannase/feruloyl esterase family alpha/beta hydrolase n=1 Tax=Alloacidobacterium dinghuense TaxID=2763107 RepID=A0A7G8BCU8_9BACT|nr:tannase/feruloyl esterase family alpha/beta hydrolase [Alloacidobacterium dinghuense]QNI30368.1 tannase/feruloyl esterase family alpha/beta hydrolase [Alloacidobacterium dinghuense]
MRTRAFLLLLSALLAFRAAAFADDAASAQRCAELKRLAIPEANIVSAEIVAAGVFTPPDLKTGQRVPHVYKTAPSFCRVVATLKPTADSDIKVEVWMPASGWNGKFRGQGNGGFAGYIAYAGLAASVSQGYAAASTDTGHSTPGAEWALGHPEKVVDYGYRAVHEMTVDAKGIVKAFYDDDVKRSYFASCSNGGRQALMEAQRFPEDYDGIIAGAPANAWVPMLTNGLNLLQATDQAGYIPAAKIPAIGKAVLATCDAKDGVMDGVLNDPRECHFDPSTLLCKGANSDSCLTAPQVDSLKKIYVGLHDAAGKQIFPGVLPGAEEGRGGWGTWITGSEEGKSAGAFYVTGYFTNMVYGKSDWDFKTAKIDDSLKLAYEKTGDSLDAMNPDLKPFLARGKLILYHGWNDPGISPLNSVNYYTNVVGAVGARTAEQSMRLYMVPGMQHCGGGPGATSFGQDEAAPRSDASHDIFTALVQWVENGNAPSQIVATKFNESDPANDSPRQIEMTRPLCTYPQVAKYNGSGAKNLAQSFVCVADDR